MPRKHVRAHRTLVPKTPAAGGIAAEPAQEIHVRVAVHEQVRGAIAVPVGHAERAAAAAAVHAVVEAEETGLTVLRLAVAVVDAHALAPKNALRRTEDERAIGRATAGEQREVALVVGHHEVHQAVAVPVDHLRCGAPLGDELAALRVPPVPRGLG